MDVALGRPDFGPMSRAVIEWCQHTPKAAVVAWHTISNLFYLLNAARDDSFARAFLRDVLEFASVPSAGTQSVRQALAMRMTDLEDALQVAAAIAGDANFIITRNVAHYRGSPVSALRPTEFLKRFVSR